MTVTNRRAGGSAATDEDVTCLFQRSTNNGWRRCPTTSALRPCTPMISRCERKRGRSPHARNGVWTLRVTRNGKHGNAILLRPVRTRHGRRCGCIGPEQRPRNPQRRQHWQDLRRIAQRGSQRRHAAIADKLQHVLDVRAKGLA